VPESLLKVWSISAILLNGYGNTYISIFLEAKKCNSYIWQFLCYLLIIKANAALHKVERTSEALDLALKISKELKEKHIHNFLTACIHCNEEEFIVKKQSIFANSRRESEKSVYSSLSVRHSN